MQFLCNNLAAICVATMVSLMAWLLGGMQAPILERVVPWAMIFMLEVILVFPQKHEGESTYEARSRAWSAMKRDPVVWTALGFLLLLAIPFTNNGYCQSCYRELIAQTGIDPEPPMKFLPYCLDRTNHLNVFLWFVVALSAMVATRHCLTGSGKRLMVKMIVWNGFALAILGFLQIATGAEGVFWTPLENGDTAEFFSTFWYPNMAGDYFTTLFGMAVAMWRLRHDEVAETYRHRSGNVIKKSAHKLFWMKNLYLIPAAIFYFAALNTLSRAAIILVNVLLVAYFLHSFFSFTHRLRRVERVRRGGVCLAIAALVVFFASISIPERMQREVDTLNPDAVLTRVTGKGQYHVRVATAIWRDNFLFGCGGWGYKHLCIPKMLETSTPEEVRKELQMVGGVNVHNDYLQFLAEHGVVGFGALVAIVVMLMIPVGKVWRRLVRQIRFVKKSELPPKPVQLFVLPAPAFCILMTLVATFIHGFGDCPLRSLAVLTLFFVLLATLPGFLPRLDYNCEPEAMAGEGEETKVDEAVTTEEK